MFVLIHGDDEVKTRQLLSTYVNKAKERAVNDIVTLDGKALDLETLIQNVESQSLFGESSRLTIVEQLFKTRSKTILKSITDYLSTNSAINNLILWEDHEITATQIRSLGKVEVCAVKTSPTIFKLTALFKPTTSVDILEKMLKECCNEESAEMVLIMFSRQIRMMIQSFDSKAKLPPFQKKSLETTAKAFGLEHLLEYHHQLTEMDYKNKTGKLATDLQSELAFWLAHVYSKLV